MPSKYSHNVVLASYSSQGIISLPNDEQLGYLKTYSHQRGPSAATNRQRAVSNATQSSDQYSVGRKSVRSTVDTSYIRRYDLSSATSRSRGRVVIIDSDSEDDLAFLRPPHASNLSRSGPIANHQSPQSISRSTFSANPRRESSDLERRVKATPTRSSQPKKAHGRGNQGTASPTPEERHPGVHAFIQARYEKETADDEEFAGDEPTKEDGPSISLKEFLKTAKEPNAQTHNNAANISLRDFLAAMPPPPKQRPATPPEPEVVSQKSHEAKHSKTLSMRAFRTRRWTNSPKETKTNETSNTVTDSSKAYYASSKGSTQNNSHVSIDFEAPRFARPIMASRVFAKQIEQNEGFKQTEDEEMDQMLPRSEFPPSSLVMASAKKDVTSDPHQTRPNKNVSVANEARALNSAASRHATRSKVGHSQKRSVASSGSQDSSTLGLSSTTAVGSRDSPASHLKSKPSTPQSWGLPHLVEDEPIGHSFDHLFEDDHFLAIFSSDEEADPEKREMVAPRLQTVSEEDGFLQNRFGMISAGQDSTTYDQPTGDSASEISAVYPPDIGRFKYSEGTSGPLAVALAGGDVNGVTASNMSRRVQQRRAEKNARGSIIGRLRIRGSKKEVQ